jgi:hypothetical protein
MRSEAGRALVLYSPRRLPVGSYWSDVCPVALLVNIGVAAMLDSLPFVRALGLNVLFSLSVDLGFPAAVDFRG